MTFALLEQNVLPLENQGGPVARGSLSPMCWQWVPHDFIDVMFASAIKNIICFYP